MQITTCAKKECIPGRGIQKAYFAWNLEMGKCDKISTIWTEPVLLGLKSSGNSFFHKGSFKKEEIILKVYLFDSFYDRQGQFNYI